MRDAAVSNERLWQEFEQSIRELNQRYIRAATGGVRKEHFLRAAENVARLRARYLHAVLRLEAAAEAPPIPELEKVAAPGGLRRGAARLRRAAPRP